MDTIIRERLEVLVIFLLPRPHTFTSSDDLLSHTHTHNTHTDRQCAGVRVGTQIAAGVDRRLRNGDGATDGLALRRDH